MPQFIGTIAANIAGALGASAGTALAVAEFAASYGLLAGSFGLSIAQQRAAKRRAKAAYNASQVDRMANLPSTTASRELVMGRVRKGGHVSFRGSVGTNKEQLVVVLSIAAHEIDAIEAVYLNDQQVTLDGDGYVTTAPYALPRKVSTSETFTGSSITLAHTPVADSVQVVRQGSEGGEVIAHTLAGSTVTISDSFGGTVNYQYEVSDSKAKITWHLGDQTTADADLLSLFPSEWTANHIGYEVAYAVCRFWYDETSFPSGVPNVSFLVRGAKIYDPRTTLTEWTDNPALMMRHVILHENFGRRSSLTAAEDASIVAAANACDTSHDYGDGAVAMFRSGIVVPYGTEPASALDDLAQAMAGRWAYIAGRFICKAGVYTAPVLALTESDMVMQSVDPTGSVSAGAIDITPHRTRAEKFNSVMPRIWDAGQDYKQVALTPLKGSALITRDGAEIVNEVDMPAIGYAPQALHVAGISMRDARDPLVASITFGWGAYRAELFDVITVTASRFSWSSKPFIVIDKTNNLNGTFRLTLKETAAAIYTPDASFSPQGYAPNTTGTDPWDIDPPNVTSITSGESTMLIQGDGTIVSRVLVQWDAITDFSILSGGTVEVAWKDYSATDWNIVSAIGSETRAYILGAEDGAAIQVKARTRNAVAVSDWSVQQTHVVTARSTNPDAVSLFDVTELQNGVRQFVWEYTDPPPDLAGFEVRYIQSASPDVWDSMIPLFSKDKLARLHETTEPIATSTYTFAIRAVNWSGLASSVTYKTVTFDGIAGTVDFSAYAHNEGWPGTLTNCAVSGVELIASGTSTWNDYAVAWSSTNDTWQSGSASSFTYEYSVIDRTTSAARVLTASAVADGTATIQYAASTDGVTYTSWASIPSTAITARYYKVRFTVTEGTNPARLIRAQIILYI